MTSPKSLQNNFGYAYRTGLRDNALFAGLNAVVMFFSFCLTPILCFREKTSVNEQTGQVTNINFKEQYTFLFSGSMTYMRYMIIAALLGIGLLMGIATFRFITGKKTVNVYYSLGIKRTRLFTAKYLSGLTLVGLSVAVPMLIALITNLVVLGANRYLFTAFFYLLIGMFSVVAFSYTLTAVVFTTVGTAFEGVLFSGILLLFPEILFTCLQVFIQKLVLGTPLGVNFSNNYIYMGETTVETLPKQYPQFNPLRYMSKGLYTYAQGGVGGKLSDYTDGSNLIAWKNPDFLVPIIWLLVTATLFAFGVFFYERRKAEIGGFIGKNKVLNFVGIFLVGIFGFAIVFDLLQSKGTAIALAVGAVVFVVIYAILSLILLRNVRQFVKDLPALPIQLALTALIFVFFATGYFGAANKIPETADIASAQISLPYQNYQLQPTEDFYGYYIAGMPSADTAPKGAYTEEKDIEFVRGVHKLLVDAGKTDPTVLDEDFNGVYPVSVKIVYTLKNGKQVLRNYYGVSDDILNALQQADKTVYQQSVLDRIFKDELKKVERPKADQMNGTLSNGDLTAYNEYRKIRAVRESEDIRLYNKTLTTETTLELTAEQRQTLLDCLYKDLTAQTPENHYNPQESLGLITFHLIADENTDVLLTDTVVYEGVTAVYGADDVIVDTVGGEDGESFEDDVFTGKTATDGLPNFYITADMVNTVAFLKSVGYYDALTGDKTLKAIYGTKVAERFRESYYDRWLTYGDSFACEFIGESSTADNYAEFTGNYEGISAADKPTVYKTTDNLTMQSIYKGIVTRAELSPNDYIVVLEYTDGTYAKAYVHADKMPDAVKAEIAKNQPAESFYW
ncbi:MAG: ABC transporter permease [Candidatus Fimenecus sp.]